MHTTVSLPHEERESSTQGSDIEEGTIRMVTSTRGGTCAVGRGECRDVKGACASVDSVTRLSCAQSQRMAENEHDVVDGVCEGRTRMRNGAGVFATHSVLIRR